MILKGTLGSSQANDVGLEGRASGQSFRAELQGRASG